MQRMEIHERLQAARMARGYDSAADAAKALKIPYGTYSGHENGLRGIPRDRVIEYARKYRVSAEWLLTGTGQMEDGGAAEVPVLSWISAGSMMREDVSDEALGTITVTDLPPGDWIALKVVGDSMDRISPPESIIFVDRKDRKLIPNGLYVIADEEGNATYKRYRPGPPPRFEAVSMNQAHEPIFPDGDPVVVGRVKRSMIDT